MSHRPDWEQALQKEADRRIGEVAGRILLALDPLRTEYGDSKEHQPEAAFVDEVADFVLKLSIKRNR